MVAHGRVELLAHPLSQKYLQMKWNSYGKYFHVTNLVIYMVYLIFVTIYASQLMENVKRETHTNTTTNLSDHHSEVKDFEQSNRSLLKIQLICFQKFWQGVNYQYQHRRVNSSLLHGNQSNIWIISSRIETCSVMIVSGIAILVYVAVNMLREALQIYQQRWKYIFEPNNLVYWCLYISSVIMVSPIFNDSIVSDFHFSATAIAVFLSWFNLLLFLQRFDQVR